MLAKIVVELALRRIQLAMDRLLDPLRQLPGDLTLGPAKDERLERTRQQRARVIVDLLAAARCHLEHFGAAEHPGVEEFEEAPELSQVILDRRSAERQAVIGQQKARGLGRL